MSLVSQEVIRLKIDSKRCFRLRLSLVYVFRRYRGGRAVVFLCSAGAPLVV